MCYPFHGRDYDSKREDYYCCLCGNGFYKPYLPEPSEHFPDVTTDEFERAFDNGDYDFQGLDTDILPEDDMQWMCNFVLLGEHRERKESKRCYLTGLAEYAPHGEAVVEVRVETSEDLSDESHMWSEYAIVTYEEVQPDSEKLVRAALPMHEDCMRMLNKVLRSRRKKVPSSRTRGIDLDILYSTLASRISGTHRLKLDYFETESQVYWDPSPGYEPWLTSPMDIPGLKDFALDLPKTSKDGLYTQYWKTRNGTITGSNRSDPFSSLPPEILHHIFDQLPVGSSIRDFMLSSRAAYHATLSDFFWRHRLRIDMPYLWEINEIDQPLQDVDWREVYMRMYLQSYPGWWDWISWRKATENRWKVFEPNLLAVASRRRIYHCVEQAVELYMQYERLEAPSGEELMIVASLGVLPTDDQINATH